MPRVLSFTVVPGCGVEAEIEEPTPAAKPQAAEERLRHRLRIGRPEWIRASTSDRDALLVQLHAKAGHRIDCEIDGRLAAIALVAERLRESAPVALAELKSLGLPIETLTGDTSIRAAALDLPAPRGNLTPDDKCCLIREAKQAGGKPLMIGDGVNDASALATAHVGIALSSGTDLANSAAAATLHHGDLRVLPWAIALCRDAVRTVRRNLLRAAGYNLIGIILAACGVLHPVAAALLMVVSSLWVAWSSARVGISAQSGACDMGACQVSVRNATPQAVAISCAIIHAVVLAVAARHRLPVSPRTDDPGRDPYRRWLRNLGIAQRSCLVARQVYPARARHGLRHADTGQLRDAAGLVGRQWLCPIARRRLLRLRGSHARRPVQTVDVVGHVDFRQPGHGASCAPATARPVLVRPGHVHRRQPRHGRRHAPGRPAGGMLGDRLHDLGHDRQLPGHDCRHDRRHAGGYGVNPAWDLLDSQQSVERIRRLPNRAASGKCG